MLRATKVSLLTNRYEITADGLPLTTWDGSMWRVGGRFELGGARYEIRGNLWGSKYGMVTEDATVVASANRVGRKRWTVEADGRTYEFQRASIWRQEEEWYSEGHRAGSIKRARISVWRRDTVADLPGVPVPVQIFMLAVVLTKWDESAAASAAGVSG
jgi:hypothetical protein